MSELKSCPFCGGEAYARFDNTGKGSFGYASIECKKCGAVPYVHQVYSGLSKEEAVNGVAEAWNRRVESERPKGNWTETDFLKLRECSCCHVRWGMYDVEDFNFCPCCGADMRGESDEQIDRC